LRLIVLFLALLLVAPGAHGQGEDGTVTVARVLSGNLLELDDGRLVRLAGIRLPAGADGRAAQDLARAEAALAGLVERRAVRLEPTDPPADRHGRLVAQLWRHDGLWLQGALLEQGLVQVQTRPGEAALAAELAAREQAARRSRTGIWSHGRFGPQPAHQVGALVGSFQIVQGRVARVAPTERYLYLNFGRDWRADFTLRVARSSAPSFREAGIDLERLEGQDVEIRGYVLEAHGPLIELSHPEQIRLRTKPGPDRDEPAS
jgi:endonuclease YncB( thermonuclease family)